MSKSLPSTKILGTKITTASKEEILEYIVEKASKGDVKIPIVTPNPEILMYASSHKDYQEVLNRAEIALPDGVGVVISGKILKKGIQTRITGVDFMFDLCREAAERGLMVGLLGGRDGVAEDAAVCLAKIYPRLIVSFVDSEWGKSGFEKAKKYQVEDKKDDYEKSKIQNTKYEIQGAKVDILFVAFGFPKQEIWIDENLERLPVTVAMGVGGAFDYISGRVARAPKLVRNIGMEWAFRLITEPWRIKRQLALPRFAMEVLKERLKG